MFEFTQTMKTIVRVIRVPEGDAPREIREQWLGLTICVAFIISPEDFSEECGKPVDCCGIAVPFRNALSAIAGKSQEGARWFLNNIPDSDYHLIFRIDELEVVSGPRCLEPTPKKIHMYNGLLEVGVGAHDHAANLR